MLPGASAKASPQEGLELLLCENPLPPLPEAIAAAQAELSHSNRYTEPYSRPLRELLAHRMQVPVERIHINAGSELILRQLFDRFGERVHLLLPTYDLFPSIARHHTAQRLDPAAGFRFDLGELDVPQGTTLAVIVNPNNPTGTTFDPAPLPDLLEDHPSTRFLVDEAFIGMAGDSVVPWVLEHDNLLVTRTLSKAHSLAGFRVGYAILPRGVADDLNGHNDAYPLARASQAAAIATLEHEDKIRSRAHDLRVWAHDLATKMQAMGLRTWPSQTYFFLADFAPRSSEEVAARLAERNIHIKPLPGAGLGPGIMRVTTSTPEGNDRFLDALREVL